MKITVKIENQEFLVEIEDLSSRPVMATVEGQSKAKPSRYGLKKPRLKP